MKQLHGGVVGDVQPSLCFECQSGLCVRDGPESGVASLSTLQPGASRCEQVGPCMNSLNWV